MFRTVAALASILIAASLPANAETLAAVTEPSNQNSAPAPRPAETSCEVVAQGEASVYGLNSKVAGDRSNQPLASQCKGGPCRLDVTKMTAAMLNVRYGTVVQVTHARTGKTIEVTVNDCGPHAKNRVIDLTPKAGREVGIGHAVGNVVIKVCGKNGKVPNWRWASGTKCGVRSKGGSKKKKA